jgi:aromatic ring hydroxylase
MIKKEKTYFDSPLFRYFRMGESLLIGDMVMLKEVRVFFFFKFKRIFRYIHDGKNVRMGTMRKNIKKWRKAFVHDDVQLYEEFRFDR